MWRLAPHGQLLCAQHGHNVGVGGGIRGGGHLGVGWGAAPVLWDALLLEGREGEGRDAEDVKFPLPINPSPGWPLCVFWIINGPFTLG